MCEKYANYITSVDPRNTVKVVSERKTSDPRSPRVFQRMYVCLHVLKDGWKRGCRPIIGVDGTWLKGVCKGVLLVACGRVGNDQFYPIAWAVVDTESFDTWQWFFQLIKRDLDLGDGEGFTIMSDMSKAILGARKNVLPKANERWCARHIHQAWNKTHSGDALRYYFWCASKSCYLEQWERHMAKIKEISIPAYDALMGYDKKLWVRAFFTDNSTCDITTNSNTESFNGWIRKERALPLISMFEAIYK